MIARALLTIAAAALLALASAPSASAAMRPCGKASEIADDFQTGARIAVKGRWNCSAANEVFAAWSSVVRQAGKTADTAPRRLEVGGVSCRKRTRGQRVTLRCTGHGSVVRARWKR